MRKSERHDSTKNPRRHIRKIRRWPNRNSKDRIRSNDRGINMKAVGEWVLVKQEETTTASGLTVSNLNIGEIISGNTLDFKEGDRIYFNKRNAITIEDYLLVTIHDIFLVIT